MDLESIRPRPYGLCFEMATFYGKERERKKAFKVAKEFVEELFFGISKKCTKYINNVSWDLPYAFSERTLDSVIAPVMSYLCDSIILTELPTHRYSKRKNYEVEDSDGRIDYWCIYQNYSFVIEIKHGYDTFKQNKDSDNLRKNVYEDWRTMNKQLNSLEEEIKGYQEKTKGVIRIGLHFITSRTSKELTKDLINDFRKKENIKQTMQRFSKIGQNFKLSCPDFALCWKIPWSMIEKYNRLEEYDDKIYPGFWVIAKIIEDTH